MEKDILVILMVAFGLFAIVMFILFFVYLKKYYNNKHLEEDYKRDIEETSDPNETFVEPVPIKEEEANSSYDEPPIEPKEKLNDVKVVEPSSKVSESDDMEFVPIKKK